MRFSTLRSLSFIGSFFFIAILCAACATDDGKVDNNNNALIPQSTPSPVAPLTSSGTSQAGSSQNAQGEISVSAATFRGTNYSIQYNSTWKIQIDNNDGVTISDPQYPKARLHVLVQDPHAALSPLQFKFGSSFATNCHQDTTTRPAMTIGRTTWNQSQYTCSATDGSQSQQIRILDMPSTYHNKHYSIDYASTINNFTAYSNNMFSPMLKTFQLQ